jgi:hypothetical protein
MTARTLHDARELLCHLPEDRRDRSGWRYVVRQLDTAAKPTLVSAMTSQARCARIDCNGHRRYFSVNRIRVFADPPIGGKSPIGSA